MAYSPLPRKTLVGSAIDLPPVLTKLTPFQKMSARHLLVGLQLVTFLLNAYELGGITTRRHPR